MLTDSSTPSILRWMDPATRFRQRCTSTTEWGDSRSTTGFSVRTRPVGVHPRKAGEDRAYAGLTGPRRGRRHPGPGYLGPEPSRLGPRTDRFDGSPAVTAYEDFGSTPARRISSR